MNPRLITEVKKFLRQTFFISLLFSLSVYIFVRLIFYSTPILLAEDSLIFFKTILTGWVLIMIGKGAFEGLVFILGYGHGILRNYFKAEEKDALSLQQDCMTFVQG